MLLTWEDSDCDVVIRTRSRSTFLVKKASGFYQPVRVDSAPVAAVGSAGGVLLTRTLTCPG